MGYSVKQIEAMNAADSILVTFLYRERSGPLQAMGAQSPFLITIYAQGTHQGTPSYQVEIERESEFPISLHRVFIFPKRFIPLQF